MTEELRKLLMARRQALLIELGALEDCLKLGRSRPPERKDPKHKDIKPMSQQQVEVVKSLFPELPALAQTLGRTVTDKDLMALDEKRYLRLKARIEALS